MQDVFTDLLIEFSDFLKQNGFEIPESRISRFYSYAGKTGYQLSDDSFPLLLQPVFCATPEQYQRFQMLYHTFLREADRIHQEAEEKRELQALSNAQKNKREQLKAGIKDRTERLREISRQLDAEQEKSRRNSSAPDFLTAKQKKLFEEKKKKIASLTGQDVTGKFLQKLAAGKIEENTEQMFDPGKKRILDAMKKELQKGDASSIGLLKELQNASDAAQRYLKKCGGQLREISDEEKRIAKEKEKLERELKKQKKEQEETEARINSLLREMQEIEKARSTQHRPEFLPCGNAVRVQEDGTEPAGLDKSFSSLSEQEKLQLAAFLQSNLTRFRTVMKKRINTLSHRQFDVRRTILKSCASGGVPLELKYKRPRPNRTKLILILDVSGSCKQASEMMLTFMNQLKTLFPGGCNAYGFVNSIYDISGLLETENSREAIKTVLKTIPSKGVYSNYYVPLQQLCTTYRQNFTRDAFVIWMGDFRNNKNETGEEYFKEIGRKVKKCYMLNTETMDRWDKADSICGIYRKYATGIYEVTDMRELLGFVNEIH